ncbi:MAG: proline dehydrogenase family protein [Acidobacteriota bacterium]|nr:proline dehydrogenase family protein [Acidobacteriota bacterium]
MTRNFFLYLSQQQRLRRWMETSPTARRLTSRFIAGETLADELNVTAQLKAQRIATALDHLGENVTTLEEASASAAAYLEALDQIAARALPASVSIKATQFGMDVSESACYDNVLRVAMRAQEIGTRVEIDMEDTRYTDRTITLVSAVAQKVGDIRVCIQAYLQRSPADIDTLNRRGVRVRLAKGAYNEPPRLAFRKKADVDRAYVGLMHRLFDQGTDPAIAGHDPRMIQEAMRYSRERGIAPDRFEFQMLYGIRRDLQRQVKEQGFRLRLYVPYGTAWYPYFMRRLSERPANVLFVARSLFR